LAAYIVIGWRPLGCCIIDHTGTELEFVSQLLHKDFKRATDVSRRAMFELAQTGRGRAV
jgi:hypothetical protein